MDENTGGIGAIHITICIKLDQDVTPEVAREFVENLHYEIKDTTGKVSIVAREFVENLHYEIKDTTGKVSIQDTEIIEDNIEDGEIGPIGMDEVPPEDFDSGVVSPYSLPDEDGPFGPTFNRR